MWLATSSLQGVAGSGGLTVLGSRRLLMLLAEVTSMMMIAGYPLSMIWSRHGSMVSCSVGGATNKCDVSLTTIWQGFLHHGVGKGFVGSDHSLLFVRNKVVDGGIEVDGGIHGG